MGKLSGEHVDELTSELAEEPRGVSAALTASWLTDSDVEIGFKAFFQKLFSKELSGWIN